MLRELITQSDESIEVCIPVYGPLKHKTITVRSTIALLPDRIAVGIEGNSPPELVCVYSHNPCDYIEARRTQKLLTHLKTLTYSRSDFSSVDAALCVIQGTNRQTMWLHCQRSFGLTRAELLSIVAEAQGFFPPDQEIVDVWERLLPEDQGRLVKRILAPTSHKFDTELLELCRTSSDGGYRRKYATPPETAKHVLEQIQRYGTNVPLGGGGGATLRDICGPEAAAAAMERQRNLQAKAAGIRAERRKRGLRR